jgi:site-specific recombinase XerD
MNSKESRYLVSPEAHPARRRRDPNYRGRLAQLLRQLRVLLFEHGTVAALCQRAVSAKTRKDRRLVLRRMLIDLHRDGWKLCHLKNFRQRHVLAALQRWARLGIQSSTAATYVSHLRTFVRWLGKVELLVVVDRFCAEHPHFTARRSATERDKSERAVGIDAREILIPAAQTGNFNFAIQLELIMTFGLRVREAWLFRPHLAGGSEHVHVAWGTKGGRPRTLPAPMTPIQKMVLQRAQALVRYESGSMIPPGYRLDEWSRHFYGLCRTIGLTKAAMGITAHSLRHGVLLNFFEEMAGRAAPVRQPGAPGHDPERERSARELVAQHAGHTRPQVTSAYLGKVSRLSRTSPALEEIAAAPSSPVACPPDSETKH